VLQEHEPLLPYALFDEVVAVSKSSSSGEEKTRAYGELIALLPPVSRALLGHLLLHLKQVRGGVRRTERPTAACMQPCPRAC
jgi:hypothetical protein